MPLQYLILVLFRQKPVVKGPFKPTPADVPELALLFRAVASSSAELSGTTLTIDFCLSVGVEFSDSTPLTWTFLQFLNVIIVYLFSHGVL